MVLEVSILCVLCVRLCFSQRLDGGGVFSLASGKGETILLRVLLKSKEKLSLELSLPSSTLKHEKHFFGFLSIHLDEFLLN